MRPDQALDSPELATWRPKPASGKPQIRGGQWNGRKLRDAEVVLDSILKLPEHITAITLYENEGKWHKKCHLEFADGRIERLLRALRKHNSPELTDGEARDSKRL